LANLAKPVELSAEPDALTNVSFPLSVYSYIKQSKTRRWFPCG